MGRRGGTQRGGDSHGIWIIDASGDPGKAGRLQSGARVVAALEKRRPSTAAGERAMLAVAMSLQFLADHVDVGLRADLINAVYADYFVPMYLTHDSMRSVDDLYDVDLARSVVAYDRRKPVGMALLSRRSDRGWVSGVGVLPAWRRRGIGRQMMRTVLERAREAGVRTASPGGDCAERGGAVALRRIRFSRKWGGGTAGLAPRRGRRCLAYPRRAVGGDAPGRVAGALRRMAPPAALLAG